MKSISVIMATYNNEKDIGLAVSSVLQQEVDGLELVVVNDASTDATPRILERFAARDERVVLLHNERNLGRARSRNRAIEAAQGELLAILDADDVAMPQRLAREAACLKAAPEAGMAGAWAIRIDARNCPLGLLNGPTQDATIRKRFQQLRMPFLHSSIVFRRKVVTAVGMYDPRFSRAQDGHLCRRVIQQAKALAIPEYLVLYRMDQRLEPAAARSRYRWSALAGWDTLKRSPNAAGFLNLARFLLLASSPDALVSRFSGLYQQRQPPTDQQRRQVQDWVTRLETYCHQVIG